MVEPQELMVQPTVVTVHPTKVVAGHRALEALEEQDRREAHPTVSKEIPMVEAKVVMEAQETTAAGEAAVVITEVEEPQFALAGEALAEAVAAPL